ncbi:hypothetical protein J4208_00305 [Candidatus Woesearchaeota archaeon]|nr:hypothetical protein [Candidatus Woesearchaeota archaeon]
MQINITIEKKYVWLLILVISAVSIVVAYGSNNPQVMGHTIGEVEGATPNCAANPQNPLCAAIPSSAGWGMSDVAVASALSWSTEKLSPNLVVYKESAAQPGTEARVDCDPGYIVLGGGCQANSQGTEMHQTRFTDDRRGWYCQQWGPGSITTRAYVICGKVS